MQGATLAATTTTTESKDRTIAMASASKADVIDNSAESADTVTAPLLSFNDNNSLYKIKLNENVYEKKEYYQSLLTDIKYDEKNGSLLCLPFKTLISQKITIE